MVRINRAKGEKNEESTLKIIIIIIIIRENKKKQRTFFVPLCLVLLSSNWGSLPSRQRAVHAECEKKWKNNELLALKWNESTRFGVRSVSLRASRMWALRRREAQRWDDAALRDAAFWRRPKWKAVRLYCQFSYLDIFLFV